MSPLLPPDQIVIRPPVEATSVLIPITGGCSWNLCRFCGVYKGIQAYHIRSWSEIKRDIQALSCYYPHATHVFLAGGNPTSIETDLFKKILLEVKAHFRNLQQISSYAKVLDILQKSDDELHEIAQAGLKIVYMGMESGSNEVLRYMKKGHTSRSLINVVHRLQTAGIKVSLYALLGLGGKKWSEIHAKNTAETLNAAQPDIFRFRSLNILSNTPLFHDIQAGMFEELTPLELIQEHYIILQNLSENLHSAVYNDHVSNYISYSSQDIGKDKSRILGYLESFLKDPEVANWPRKYLDSL